MLWSLPVILNPSKRKQLDKKIEKNVVRNNTINRTVVGGDDFGSLFSRGFVPHRILNEKAKKLAVSQLVVRITRLALHCCYFIGRLNTVAYKFCFILFCLHVINFDCRCLLAFSSGVFVPTYTPRSFSPYFRCRRITFNIKIKSQIVNIIWLANWQGGEFSIYRW